MVQLDSSKVLTSAANKELGFVHTYENVWNQRFYYEEWFVQLPRSGNVAKHYKPKNQIDRSIIIFWGKLLHIRNQTSALCAVWIAASASRTVHRFIVNPQVYQSDCSVFW